MVTFCSAEDKDNIVYTYLDAYTLAINLPLELSWSSSMTRRLINTESNWYRSSWIQFNKFMFSFSTKLASLMNSMPLGVVFIQPASPYRDDSKKRLFWLYMIIYFSSRHWLYVSLWFNRSIIISLKIYWFISCKNYEYHNALIHIRMWVIVI